MNHQPNVIMDEEDALAADLERRQHEEYLATRDRLGGQTEFTERLRTFVGEFPHLGAQEAAEIFDFMTDQGWLGGPRRNGAVPLPEWIAKFQKILRYIKNHPNANAIYAVLHIWDEPLLDDINGNLTQTEFADRMYPSTRPVNPAKAAVNNAVKDAQRFFNQPPRRDQRSEKACETMRRRTIERLEKPKTPKARA